MALDAGSRLGEYEIVGAIGAGGMGEVYRARDPRLGRDVALKILPAAFVDDPERLARFEREARTLAALNHPNIATIHGLESAGAVHALVMELIDGATLAELIGGASRLSLTETTAIARQIALALEAAHDAGVTHRDLKPANVKVRSDGTVKLLDFGLATTPAADGAGTPANAMSSPTLTAATAAGMILGTAAYMAPEQARGKPVDRRADVWAFGCVLFEMLSGRRPFGGEDVLETLSAVIRDEPAWSALPADLPESFRRLLRRCLEKDPKRRLSAIGDARLELDEPATETRPPLSASRRPWWIAASFLALAAALTLALWAGRFRAPAPAPPMRLTLLPPQGQQLFQDSVNIALAPDGRNVAFITGLTRPGSRLWIRSLDRLEAREIEDSTSAQLPFWSPDGEAVAFFAGGKLRVVKVAGGSPQVIADAPDGRGGTWSRNGDIVFASSNAGPLSRVSQNGGSVTAVTELRSADGETGHRFPFFLPDGDHFLFASLPGPAGQFDVYVGSLSSKKSERLLSAEAAPFYVEPGFLIYPRGGVLVAHPFDAGRRTLTGEALPIGDAPGELGIQYMAGSAGSASASGALAYLSAAQLRSRLVWLDPAGREAGAVDIPLKPLIGVAISRDGQRAVVTELAWPQSRLSLVDLARGGLTPLTSSHGWSATPVWSPDSRRIVYGNNRHGPIDLYVRGVDDVEDEALYRSAELFKWPQTWSPDGKIVFFTILDRENGPDLWGIRPGEDEPVPVVRTPAADVFGALSPDGRWLAYISSRAGAFDVYVQSFPEGGDSQRITTCGTLDWGVWWKDDGSQLLILDANLNVLLVDVRTSPAFSASPPRTVGRLRYPLPGPQSIDATPDLSRLLAVVPEQIDGARSMTVVLNWPAAIGK